jgi:phage shock protein C
VTAGPGPLGPRLRANWGPSPMENSGWSRDSGGMTDYVGPPPSAPGATPVRRQLCRSMKSRMIAGVAGGLAEYLEVDPTVLRAVIVVFSLLSGGVGGLVLYLLAWAVVPEEGKDSSWAADALHRKPRPQDASPYFVADR